MLLTKGLSVACCVDPVLSRIPASLSHMTLRCAHQVHLYPAIVLELALYKKCTLLRYKDIIIAGLYQY